MKRTTPSPDVIRLIRFTSFLWIGYLVILAILSKSFWSQQPRNLDYYLLLGYIAVFCLGLSYWRWAQETLQKAFLPLMIFIITVMPVIVNQLISRMSPLGPRFVLPEGQVLAILPFLFTGLLLVAWQYKWQYMLFVILGIMGLNFLSMWSSSDRGSPPFQGMMVITLIQAVVYLAVGFSISYLMSRIRRQQESLEAANLRLTHYAGTLEQLTTSRERNRLARELHDTLAHSLSGLSVQLETVKAYWDIDPPAARLLLDKSLTAAHAGLEETRRALKALRASPLDDLGLAMALKTMAEDAAARAKLALDLSITKSLPVLSPDLEQGIYRIAQEAVTNAVKHARATNLAVKLESIQGKTVLTVHDDGISFDINKSEKTAHFGITVMQERAQLMAAELKITGEPGNGTTVQLTI
ncbi:MAG: sensor histidine kinase [Dehalococcoidales bacterium]|jgi:signal transduction histidine kinase